MRKLICIFLPALFLTSCEKMWMEGDPANSPHENFDALWTTVDEKYSYFELKNIDWDSVRTVYEAQLRDDMHQGELFDLMADMLYILEDGHVNLRSPFDVSRNWKWYLDYPENFHYSLVQRHYLGENYRISGPFQSIFIDSVGYIYYGSFGSDFADLSLDYLMDGFRNAKGIILDLRNNGGGSLGNAERLASRFATSRKKTYSEYYKSGPEHDDFELKEENYIGPSGHINYDGPLVILTNRRCYSATNAFVAMLRRFDHVQTVGDRTGGGGGLPISHQLPNGWIYRFSATRSVTPDGIDLESGFAPDVEAELAPGAVDNGRDDIIEAALDLLR